MKFLGYAVAAALCAWWFNILTPHLAPLVEDWSDHFVLLTLLAATVFGGLALIWSERWAPLRGSWAIPLHVPAAGCTLVYLACTIPSAQGVAFCSSVWNEPDLLDDGATGVWEALQRAWSISRETRAPAPDYFFLWSWIGAVLFTAPFYEFYKAAPRAAFFTFSALATGVIVVFGNAAQLKLAGFAIGTPLAFFALACAISQRVPNLRGGWKALLARFSPNDSAAMRKLGIRARFYYALAALPTGLWIYFYSKPAVLSALEAGWDTPLFLALATVLCGCLWLSVATRYSPIYVRRLDLGRVFGVLFFSGLGFYAYKTFPHTRNGSWLPQGAHHLRESLVVIVTPFVLLGVATHVAALKEYVREHPFYRKLVVLGRGGSARFGGMYSYIKYDFCAQLRGRRKGRAPILIGETTWDSDHRLGKRLIGVDSNAHLLCVAAPGGGKSLFSAWSILLHWGLKGRGGGAGAFVLDPKGEHSQRSGPIRAESGPVHYVDNWRQTPHLYEKTGDGRGAYYNPIDDINLKDPAQARAGLDQISKACYIPPPNESANSTHFRRNAQLVMMGVMCHILSTLKPKYHNLPSIYDAFLRGSPDGVGADPVAFEVMMAAMSTNEAFGGIAIEAARVYEAASPNERGGFLTSLSTGLRWCNRPEIRPFLMKSSFSMHDMRNKNATVFVSVPFEMMEEEDVRHFLRLMVGMALYSSRKGSPKKRILYLLDEVMQLGAFSPIQRGLVTLRSRGAKLALYLQTSSQLDQYSNRNEFMAGTDKLFFAVNDTDNGTAEVVVKELGRYVARSPEGPRHDTTHDLRSATEVREDLRKGSGIAYFLPTDGMPLRLALVPFYRFFRRYGKVRNSEDG